MRKQPNIIFFFSDQQRWDTAGCYGQTLNVTPNLDQLANEGMLFQNAFTCQPVCGPARACLQTGLYATQTGCYRNQIALPTDADTIAGYLKNAGYQTAYVGKWHLASTGGPSNQEIGVPFDCRVGPVPPDRRGGYEYWRAADALEHTSHGYDGYIFDEEMNQLTFEGYRTDCITEYALDYIKSADKEKPFFLFLSHLEPHHQNDKGRFEGPDGSKERFAGFEQPGDLVGESGDWLTQYPDYLGACNRLDYNLGRLRTLLKELNLDDNTIIFYTSDHGCHFKTRNQEYKRSCHDASLRIPLVIYGGAFIGGKIAEELVSLIDIPATILKCAGIEQPEKMQGNQLQGLATGCSAHWPEEVFYQISESFVGRGIRTKRWTYCVSAPTHSAMCDSYSMQYEDAYLYDLQSDPYQKNNLVGNPEYQPVCEELSRVLIKRMTQAGEAVPEIKR